MSSITFNRDSDEGKTEELMSAALFVEAADAEEEEGPPQDGMAYLRQVIQERKRVPETVTATVSLDTVSGTKKKRRETEAEEEESSEDQSRTKAAPPAGCCPGAAWQRDQVAAFSEVRLGAARHAQLGRDTGEVGTSKYPTLCVTEGITYWCRWVRAR